MKEENNKININQINIELSEIDELIDSCIADIYKNCKNEKSIIEAKSELSDGTNVGPSLVVHHNKDNNKEQCLNESNKSAKIKWDQDVINLFNEKFPNKDIYNMSLDELKHLRDDVEALREEFSLIEQAYKVLSNGAYGASANAKGFYFYNLAVAGDITGECRELTKYFWTHLEEFFHETIWDRKDLWQQFGFELDENKRELCRSLPVSCYSDTDSVVANSIIYIKENNKENNIRKITISQFEELLKNKYGCVGYKNENGQLMYAVPNCISVLNIKDGKPIWCKIRYLMSHEVNKPLYNIKTESGKSVTVTSDHSCIVIRNGKQIEIKAKDINIKTDKFITLKNIDICNMK